MKKHLTTVAMFFAAILVAVCLAGVVSAEDQPVSPDTQVVAPTDTQPPVSTDAPAPTDTSAPTEAPAPK